MEPDTEHKFFITTYSNLSGDLNLDN